MESITLPQLWTVAAVLAGFQVNALTWRFKREISMEEKGYLTWITLADDIVLGSFLVLVIGVFVVPVGGSISIGTVAKLLGTAITLFAAFPLVLAGHYNLYCSWGKKGPRLWATKQEWTATGISAPLIAIGLCWIWS